jgi:hypothetical protein
MATADFGRAKLFAGQGRRDPADHGKSKAVV